MNKKTIIPVLFLLTLSICIFTTKQYATPTYTQSKRYQILKTFISDALFIGGVLVFYSLLKKDTRNWLKYDILKLYRHPKLHEVNQIIQQLKTNRKKYATGEISLNRYNTIERSLLDGILPSRKIPILLVLYCI